MVIDNLDFVGLAIAPDKANAPLTVDAEAVLPFPITFQSLQSVASRDARSSKTKAALSIRSFRYASTCTSSGSFRENPSSQIVAVSLQRKPCIKR